MRKRYRYSKSSGITPFNTINELFLICGSSKGKLRLLCERCPVLVRIEIPDDMVLIHDNSYGVDYTEDRRTLEELNYDIVVLINNKFVVRNDLKSRLRNNVIRSAENVLVHEDHMIRTGNGLVTKEHYEKYNRMRNIRIY